MQLMDVEEITELGFHHVTTNRAIIDSGKNHQCMPKLLDTCLMKNKDIYIASKNLPTNYRLIKRKIFNFSTL